MRTVDFENQLSPQITSGIQLPLESQLNNQILFSLMDWNYFLQWRDVITIPPVSTGYIKYLGLYIWTNSQKVEFDQFIQSHAESFKKKGIYLISVKQDLLEHHLKNLSFDYSTSLRINYLRSARFLFAPIACEQLREMGYNFKDRYVYILDADHITIREISSELKAELGNSLPFILLAWNSGFYKHSNYTNKLSGSQFCNLENKSIKYFHGKPYISIKAGFFAFLPFRSESTLFLRMVSDYALGGPGTLRMRMFNFYYGDQLALHLAADDLYKYFSKLSFEKLILFIDLYTSNTCNLSLKNNPCIFMPKGSSVKNVLSEYQSSANYYNNK